MERLVGIGAAWKLLGQVGVQSIRLITVGVLAHLLTPADYGAAAIAIALATFAPTIADMGIGSALVQTSEATRVVRSTAFWASVVVGFALCALFAAAAGPVGAFLDDPRVGSMVAVGGITFVLYAVGSTSQALFMREMRFRSIELRYWFALAVASVVALVSAVAGAGAWALILQQLAIAAAFVAALWWRAGWRPAFEFSGQALRLLGSFALRVAGGRWARLLELLVLSLLIGKLVGVPALGAWSFAMSTVILPLTVIAIPIAEVLFSAFSRLRGEPERIAALWLDSIRFLAAVVLPLLLGLIVVAPDLIPLVFGANWKVSVGIIQLLSVYVIIRSLQAWSSVVMDAVGRPQVTLWTQLGALCLTPIGVVVGSHWGVEAVAIGFVLSQLIAVEIPMLFIVLSELRVSLGTLVGRLAGVAAAAALMTAACLLGRLTASELGMEMAERAAATIAIGLVVYPAALWCFAPDIGRRAMTLVQGFRSRMPGGRRRARPAVGTTQ